MGVPDHEPFAELTGPYALGALSEPERQSFEAHMAGCAICAAEVRSLLAVTEALGRSGTPADPSPDVRAKLLRAVAGGAAAAAVSPAAVGPQASLAPWLALAASLVAAIGLGVYANQLRGRVSMLESALFAANERAAAGERLVADARRESGEMRTTLAVLVAPDVARIDLKGQPAAPSASARAFWSRSRGLVFAASNLPAPPPGRTYQLWVLTAQPAPISAGVMRPDADGRISATFSTPSDIPQPVAMAVTLEPDGGVPSPTGDKYLVGLAN